MICERPWIVPNKHNLVFPIFEKQKLQNGETQTARFEILINKLKKGMK